MCGHESIFDLIKWMEEVKVEYFPSNMQLIAIRYVEGCKKAERMSRVSEGNKV